MKTSDSAFTQWIFPLLFIGCAGWIIWHGATYIMAFGGYTDALAARYRQINFLDYLALIGLPIFFHTRHLNRKASANGDGRLYIIRSDRNVHRQSYYAAYIFGCLRYDV